MDMGGEIHKHAKEVLDIGLEIHDVTSLNIKNKKEKSKSDDIIDQLIKRIDDVKILIISLIETININISNIESKYTKKNKDKDENDKDKLEKFNEYKIILNKLIKNIRISERSK